MSNIDDTNKGTSRIDVPDDIPENDDENPNRDELKKNRHNEVPKLYGPARPHRINRIKLPFKNDRNEIAVVYGPAEWFTAGPVVDDENKPDKPDAPDAE